MAAEPGGVSHARSHRCWQMMIERFLAHGSAERSASRAVRFSVELRFAHKRFVHVRSCLPLAAANVTSDDRCRGLSDGALVLSLDSAVLAPFYHAFMILLARQPIFPPCCSVSPWRFPRFIATAGSRDEPVFSLDYTILWSGTGPRSGSCRTAWALPRLLPSVSARRRVGKIRTLDSFLRGERPCTMRAKNL